MYTILQYHTSLIAKDSAKVFGEMLHETNLNPFQTTVAVHGADSVVLPDANLTRTEKSNVKEFMLSIQIRDGVLVILNETETQHQCYHIGSKKI